MKKSVLLKKPAEKSRYRPEKRADRESVSYTHLRAHETDQ